MQVQIAFDTEKESLEDLKKLAMAIQDLVAEREKQCGMAPSQPQANSQQPQTNNQQLQTHNYQPQQCQQPQKPIPKDGKTAGGGRVVPYDESMSNMMSGLLYSGKKRF